MGVVRLVLDVYKRQVLDTPVIEAYSVRMRIIEREVEGTSFRGRRKVVMLDDFNNGRNYNQTEDKCTEPIKKLNLSTLTFRQD